MRTVRARILKGINDGTARRMARELGVHVSHIYAVRTRGIGPTLRAACQRAGWYTQHKRHIRAIEFDSAEEAAAYDDWRAANKYTRRDVARWWLDMREVTE